MTNALSPISALLPIVATDKQFISKLAKNVILHHEAEAKRTGDDTHTLNAMYKRSDENKRFFISLAQKGDVKAVEFSVDDSVESLWDRLDKRGTTAVEGGPAKSEPVEEAEFTEVPPPAPKWLWPDVLTSTAA